MRGPGLIQTPNATLDILVHVETLGDVRAEEGQALISRPGHRIEGIQITTAIPDLEVHYMAHLANSGDTKWATRGQFVGTRGHGRRLEGIAVKLAGKEGANYDVKYFVQMRGVAKSPVCSNGEYAGTKGEHRTVEGVAVWLEPKSFMPYIVPPEVYANLPQNELNNNNNNSNNNCTHTSTNISMTDIDAQYNLAYSRKSDIHEHLPTLYSYSLGCTTIAEFGVRSVVSTWAFLKGLKDTQATQKKLICVDLERSPNIVPAETAALQNNIRLEFIQANDLTVDLGEEGVDLLFIDTWHVYPQLKRELEIHSPKVKKYIALHDTEVDKVKGESVRLKMNIAEQSRLSGFSQDDIRTGLGKAIVEFIAANPNWKIHEVYTNCNGLTILQRVGERN